MDKTEKTIVTTTAAVTIPLVVAAVVLKVKSRKLGTRIELRKEIETLLEQAKTAGTEAETNELIVKALAAWDALDSKTFKKTFSK